MESSLTSQAGQFCGNNIKTAAGDDSPQPFSFSGNFLQFRILRLSVRNLIRYFNQSVIDLLAELLQPVGSLTVD